MQTSKLRIPQDRSHRASDTQKLFGISPNRKNPQKSKTSWTPTKGETEAATVMNHDHLRQPKWPPSWHRLCPSAYARKDARWKWEHDKLRPPSQQNQAVRKRDQQGCLYDVHAKHPNEGNATNDEFQFQQSRERKDSWQIQPPGGSMHAISSDGGTLHDVSKTGLKINRGVVKHLAQGDTINTSRSSPRTM